MKHIYIILITILFCSCSEDKVQVIPNELRSYVDMFFDEGNSRGFNKSIDDFDFTIQFGSLDGVRYGQCSFQNNTITIDQEKWDLLTEERKVWLVFHELGHCVLGRQHRNKTMDNGECISIMKGLEGNFNCSFNYYSDKWWSYYIDELFNPNIQIPNWYREYEDYNSAIPINTILSIDSTLNYLEINSLDLALYPNFSIDFKFNNHGTKNTFVEFFLGNIGFSDCDICTGPNVYIYSDKPDRSFFASLDGEIKFNNDIKLTIRKIGDELYFYVNERFIHTIEDSLRKGSIIKSYHFKEPIQIELKINKLE